MTKYTFAVMHQKNIYLCCKVLQPFKDKINTIDTFWLLEYIPKTGTKEDFYKIFPIDFYLDTANTSAEEIKIISDYIESTITGGKISVKDFNNMNSELLTVLPEDEKLNREKAVEIAANLVELYKKNKVTPS